jgi:hypothetical protein
MRTYLYPKTLGLLLTVALPLAAAFAKAMQGNRPEELYPRKAQFVIGNDLRDYIQRFAASRRAGILPQNLI